MQNLTPGWPCSRLRKAWPVGKPQRKLRRKLPRIFLPSCSKLAAYFATANQADTFMSRALNGQLEMRAQLSPASTNELKRIETSVSRLTWALVLIALIACGTLLLINSFTAVGVIALLMGLAALIKLVTL